MRDEPIAIVGAACRFPGADGLDAFWDLLRAGKDAVDEIDSRRWAARFFYHPHSTQPGKSYTWAAGLIDRIDHFEPSFFGISPREAMQMDPQQRILLELVWHAFEDAGIPPSRFRGTETGVYIGASATDYSDLTLGDPAVADAHFMTGNALSILSNRISYIFDLRGPSLTVDTACSSSLVALHHACETIRAGRIASAIVGGVNLLLSPYPFLGFCRASMLSRRGRCFAFDARADGYVRAEGAAVAILKPLSDAVADRDPVRAVIVASGCNSDGRTIGLSLPNEAAQAALLRSVYQRAGIAAEDLAFVEMHGTGTPAGDPIEAAAVGRLLGSSRSRPLPIGSVKTNIGHLEPASGMAGLLKTMLALDNRLIPPTLHCETPNPKIDFADLNLRLVRDAEPIAAPTSPPLAAVNAFGFGGTNAHAILAGAPAEQQRADEPQPLFAPLLISAATQNSLRELAARWRSLLDRGSDEGLADRVRAAARGREHLRQRMALLCRDQTSAADALDRFLANARPPGIITGGPAVDGRLAFVYAGNGAQFPGMGRLALRTNPVFRAAVESADEVLRPELGWSVVDRIANGVDGPAVARADVAQPVLFAVQVGIVEALRDLGIVAEGHFGHSVGEIAAAWAAGALSLADAARVVLARSRGQQRTAGAGRMAALALGPEPARELLAEIGGNAEIAAVNTVRSVTVSGTVEEIARLAEAARERGVWCRPLDLDFAFHSRLMDPIREELRSSLAGLRSRPATARLVSTVTGAAVETAALDAEHWWRNIRSPVRFAEAAARLIDEGFRIFVEIGPNPILHSYLIDGLGNAEVEGRVLASLSRQDADVDPFPTIAARCYVAGYDWPAARLFDGRRQPRGVPLYPRDSRPFWFEKTVEAAGYHDPPFDHPLLGFRQHGPLPNWLNHLDEHVLPWLADHRVEDAVVYPAAAIVESALAAARHRSPEATVLEAAEIELRRPLTFDSGTMRELRMMLTSEDGDWQLIGRPRLAEEAPQLYAVGQIVDSRSRLAGADAAEASPTALIEGDTLYRLARRWALGYGPRFKTVARVELFGGDHALVHLDAGAIADELASYLLHPALLDGAFQGFLALLAQHDGAANDAAFLPWRFERVRLTAPFGRACKQARLWLKRAGVRSLTADIALYDEAGAIVAELNGCWFRQVGLGRRRSATERLFHVAMVPAPQTRDAAARALAIAKNLARLATAPTDNPARREQAALLEAAIGAASYSAWRVLAAANHPFTLDGLAAMRRISPDALGLAECLLQSLERIGGATEDDGQWRIETPSNLPDPAEIWRLLLADAPDLVAELALLGEVFDDFSDLLARGPQPPQPAHSGLVRQLVQGSPASRAGIDLLTSLLRAVAADWPPGQPLRILEIGAESATTRRFLQGLANSSTALAYLATSPDPEQVERLRTIAAAFPGAAVSHWVPGGGPIEAGRDGRFDLVLMVNGCARFGLDEAVLSTLPSLIEPGGGFIAIEPEPNPVWDVIFGCRGGWWRRDHGRAARSPLRGRMEWQAMLAAAGFAAVDSAAVTAGPWPLAAIWATAPARVAADGSGRQRLDELTGIRIIAEASALRGALADNFIAAGHRVSVVEPQAAQTCRPQERDDKRPELAVFLAGHAAEAGGTAQQLAAIALIAHQAAEHGGALCIVTVDEASVDEASASAAARRRGGEINAAAITGLARVLANELPRLPLRMIQLSAQKDATVAAARIAAEIAAGSSETEIAWTANDRRVPRLRRGLPAGPRQLADHEALRLAASATGGLESLHWAARPASPPDPGQIEIEVRAAGLNFRDVMWAMGLLPEEALADGFAGPTFGLECAGIVRRLGAGVDRFRVGDRVMAFAPAALGTRAITLADAAAPIPPDIGFTEAATLPVAFVTAIYALDRLAQLEPGEHVLIHAAAGGVGLAAIQIAKRRGAIVIATAGSETKRRFLRLVGADYVLASRDLGFAEAVRQITDGAGVDVVLNSLSGEAMERSLQVLKPFGRFLELGKRDLYSNHRLHLRPLRHNITYFAIDIDQLPRRRPAVARALLAEISTLLGDGSIRPLAHRVFRYSESEDAFRLMQASGHIGKIVLVPDAQSEAMVRDQPRFTARRDGTYLVTGGIDGFGFEAARWLAENGAGAIALVSRRGSQTPRCAERVAELEAAGAAVQVYRGDIGDRASVAQLLDELRAVQPPLRGVVHAAAVIEDRLTADLAPSDVAAVLRPKIDGALALDELTREDPIELFLLFSSATTLLGAPGQGAYVAANAALEALARRRHTEGRPALAVMWGPIADAGYLAERPQAREALARRLGALPVPAAEALAALPAMLASGLPVVAYAAPVWGETARALPILAAPLFSEVREGGGVVEDDGLLDRLRHLEAGAAQTLLRNIVLEEAGRILRQPADEIDPAQPLSQMGMDSLMAVELRLALEGRLRVDLPLVSLAEGTSVTSIATRLANALALGDGAAEIAALAERHLAPEESVMALDDAAAPKSAAE